MKNLRSLTIILALAVALTTACSQQTRSNAWDPSVEEIASSVQDFLNEAGVAANAGAVSEVKSFVEGTEQRGVIYYAESGKTGLPSSVASILNFGIFGLPEASLYDITSAKVLLLDQTTEQGAREFIFVLSIKLRGEDTAFQSAAFKTTDFTFTDHKATLRFENFNLYTFDVDDDYAEDFAGVVQFQVEDKGGVNFGQFSSLIGFGN